MGQEEAAEQAVHELRSGKLDRARSRLYRNQILQVNMRLKALAEIYTMQSFAQLCNLNLFVKILPKNLLHLAKFSKIRQIWYKFGKISICWVTFWQIFDKNSEIGERLSWPGSFLSTFFLVFGDSIPKRCEGVHCVDLGERFPTNIWL